MWSLSTFFTLMLGANCDSAALADFEERNSEKNEFLVLLF